MRGVRRTRGDALLIGVLAVAAPLIVQAIHIDTVHDSEAEHKTAEQLGALLRRYNISPWLFTRSVRIDERAIPHSHPVLTLHTRHLGQDILLLSTFLHEQLHWFLDSRQCRRLMFSRSFHLNPQPNRY